MTTGMFLGKFLPPHLGHVFLADFARKFCDRLHVLVCTLDREPIPGHLRFEWMRELIPHENVMLQHVTDDVPQAPEEHPDFWAIWRDLVRGRVPEAIDYVFASEAYGRTLADVLGAKFIPCDIARDLVPVSGTAIRKDPLKHWEFIPVPVRPYFVKRVCLFGPESTGKTTLARDLARHYHTVYAHEYARPLLDLKEGRCDPEDFAFIARGQAATEDAMARQANRILFCDTDPLLTVIWHRTLVGAAPAWLDELADSRRYDLYLLLDIDVPWVNDGQRYFPDPAPRQTFFEQCEEELKRRNRQFIRISGDWANRKRESIRAMDSVLHRSIKD
jgi:NadR type nicotinamide-nucleotide adenylyltransferase